LAIFKHHIKKIVGIWKNPIFATVAMSNYISFGMVWVCLAHTIFDDEQAA